jgi:hypothetical protein
MGTSIGRGQPGCEATRPTEIKKTHTDLADMILNYPYFDVVVRLVWSHDPKSYGGGSICYW